MTQVDFQEVKARLRRLIAQAMYMEQDEVAEDELFSNFGLESLTLAKLVAKLNEHYGVRIEVRAILKHQTLRAAAAFAQQQINEQNALKETLHAR